MMSSLMDIYSSVEGQKPISQTNVDEFSARYDYDVDDVNNITSILCTSEPSDSQSANLFANDHVEALSLMYPMDSTSIQLPLMSHNPVLTESAVRTPHQSSQPLALSPFSQEAGPFKGMHFVNNNPSEMEIQCSQSSCMLSPAPSAFSTIDYDGNSREWMECLSPATSGPCPREPQVNPRPGPSKRSSTRGKKKLPKKEELLRRKEINREASAKYRRNQKRKSSDAEIQRDKLQKEYDALVETRKSLICELKGAVEAVLRAKKF